MNTELEDAAALASHNNRLTLLREVYRDGPQPVTGRLFDLMFNDVLCESWCRMVGLKYTSDIPAHEGEPQVYIFSVNEQCEIPETEEIKDDEL
jgi:hypothetical protein